ncbi:type 2 isopentenyl-diphosphate Delta-isomerase [Salsuginibacillus kocurii]|uniref:type 2 isopentenyl-diphosphate Delta-isomerase n=1 Tax=Salsuginibacillus kocurii TaxID=427078 RepID=UPI0003755F52|nr:type 2 isopentenyl-diphosphate Delta-isomerase [Salsuginibacillus kocurii]
MSRAERKRAHIEHALETGFVGGNGLDDVQFVHNSLPETSLSQTKLDTTIGELPLSSPIVINAMTGGGGQETKEINGALARACAKTNTALAVGSQMAALKDPNEKTTYETVRSNHPNGTIFANLGNEADVEQAKQAVEMIEADALQIHLNPIQELVMPEGDRDFTGTLTRLEQIVTKIEVPLIVKEVGFGLSYETVRQLHTIGVQTVDTGGRGGTNFSKIENKRRDNPLAFFDRWGLSTAVSLCEALEAMPKGDVIASGGIRGPEDIAKALALGASACGLAGQMLLVLKEEGEDGVVAWIEETINILRVIMTALGVSTIQELQQVPLVIQGNTKEWLLDREFWSNSYQRRTRLSI